MTDSTNPTPADPAKPEPPTEERKKKKRRRWPWVILSILVIIILLIAFAPMIASTGPVRSLLISKINNNLNGTLAVNDWSIGWTSGVVLNGVKIDDDRGRRIVEVSSIRVPVSLIGAARGNYDLGDTVIDKPHLVNVQS